LLLPSGGVTVDGVTVDVVLESFDPPELDTVEPGVELDFPGRASAAAAAISPVAATAPAATHAVRRYRRRRPWSRDRGFGAFIASSVTGESGSQLRIP
jgi:hypothetical protein